MILSLFSAVLSGEPALTVVVQICALAFVIVCCLPFHEAAHAFAAYKLVDPTAKNQGRLTLNPVKHLTLFGVVLMVIAGFGYAKPVPVNINNFKNRKLGFALTSIAGPLSNFLLGFIFTFLTILIVRLQTSMSYEIAKAAYLFFQYVAYMNIALAIFNLIPVPPLDGSRLITLVLPNDIYYKLLQYERYFVFGILGLVFILNRLGFSPISRIAGLVFTAFARLFQVILL